MNRIPLPLRRELARDPFYKVCARQNQQGHICEGRVTWEHAIIFAGNQVQAKWAIVPLCAKAHGVDQFQDGGDLDKQVNEWIALNRAEAEELSAVSRVIDYRRRLSYLNGIYGPYVFCGKLGGYLGESVGVEGGTAGGDLGDEIAYKRGPYEYPQ